MMKIIHTKLLLEAISNNTDINALLIAGLTYSQIADAITELKESGLVALVNSRLQLTPCGLKKLEKIQSKAKMGSSSDWIVPLVSRVIPGIRKNDIYIPDLYVSAFFKPRRPD